jgi:hypothetical protein
MVQDLLDKLDDVADLSLSDDVPQVPLALDPVPSLKNMIASRYNLRTGRVGKGFGVSLTLLTTQRKVA